MRIRQRRIMLGLTQQQMAELIGVTYQQAHKYETGINRISAGRLYQIAQALGVEIGYFFDDLELDQQAKSKATEMMPQQRMLLELARNFAEIGSRKHQDAICNLARVLAAGERQETLPDSARVVGKDEGSASPFVTHALAGRRKEPAIQRAQNLADEIPKQFELTVYMNTPSREKLEALTESVKNFLNYLGYEEEMREV